MKAFFLMLAVLLAGAAAQAEDAILRHAENLSVRNEAQSALGKGLTWLASQQQADGSWGEPEVPGLAAKCLYAMLNDPDSAAESVDVHKAAEKALRFLRDRISAKDEHFGNDADEEAETLAALVRAHRPEDEELMTRVARQLLAQQMPGGRWHADEGPRAPFTHLRVAAALRLYESVSPATPGERRADWPAAQAFARKSFPSWNRPGTTDPLSDLYGFGRYLTLKYSGVPDDAEEARTALEWVRAHALLEASADASGAHFQSQLHLMTRALSLAGLKTVNWSQPIALKLINTQTSAGAWETTGTSPVRATADALLALEVAIRGM